MTIDLWMLVASVGLSFVLTMLAATPSLLRNPLWALGNRDEVLGVVPKLQGRLQRADANLRENLPMFAALVLVVQVAGQADATSALGAQLFFWGRVAHAAVYVVGVPYVRTLIWAASVTGMVIIASVLF